MHSNSDHSALYQVKNKSQNQILISKLQRGVTFILLSSTHLLWRSPHYFSDIPGQKVLFSCLSLIFYFESISWNVDLPTWLFYGLICEFESIHEINCVSYFAFKMAGIIALEWRHFWKGAAKIVRKDYMERKHTFG